MAATPQAKKSSPAAMPIEDYDRLPIKEILPLLNSLSTKELKAVAAYEKASKNRVTLLRGVHKVELARQSAAPKRPAKAKLAVVDDDNEVVIPTTAPVAAPVAAPVKAPVKAVVVDDLDDDNDVVDPTPATVSAKVVPVKKSRPRPVVKAATWEEELRPQLPRRFETSKLDDFEPPVVALVSESPALVPPPPSTPLITKAKAPKALRAISDKPQVVKRFESVALVMAAILAVLLGLAIGTVLARTGSSDASPAPTSVASQAAVVQTAG